KKVSPSGVAQNMAPSSGLLDPIVPASSDRRTASGIDHDAVAVPQRRRQIGIAVASGYDFGLRPNFRAQLRKRSPVFRRPTTGQKNSGARNFFRKLAENQPQ